MKTMERKRTSTTYQCSPYDKPYASYIPQALVPRNTDRGTNGESCDVFYLGKFPEPIFQVSCH